MKLFDVKKVAQALRFSCISTFIRMVKLMSVWMCCFCILSAPTHAKERYSAPNLNEDSGRFMQRFDQDLFNVDFFVAHVLNLVNQALLNGEELDDRILFNDGNTGSATAGSVIVPFGTDIDELVVVNINEGDTIAVDLGP